MNTISAHRLIAELETLHAEATDGVLAFDGDGTLWSGDVGEDVFNAAIREDAILDAAHEALLREASLYDISQEGSPSALAARLFEAYLKGQYPERAVCAMMAWCYAGWTLSELHAHIRRALQIEDFDVRLNRELEPVFTFARDRGVRVVVVSASPKPAVDAAAKLWRIGPEDVVASEPMWEGERLRPRLKRPVPYAETKVTAFAEIANDKPLLATFGDNVFDFELLSAARLAVAVRPKPALRSRLLELARVVVLEPSP